MSELTPAPRLRSQLAAIAHARWRLMANSIRTTRGALEMVSRLWVGFWLSILGVAGAIGFGVAGWFFLSRGTPEWIAFPLWGLFLFWQVFPLAASTFTEHIDTSNLVRYPLRYRAYVLVRLLFGALEIASIFGCLCLVGLIVGVSLARHSLLPWAALAALGFAAFNLLLELAIFAWLERWLAGRRTREILMALVFVGIFCVNLIGPLSRRLHLSGRFSHPGAQPGWVHLALLLQRWLPPGLAAHAVASAAAGRHAWSLAALIVLAAWMGLVLRLLHLRLLAEYRGENLSRTAAPARARAQLGRRRLWPPDFRGPAGAVAQKELRYLLRSPMMLFSLVMPLVMLVFLRLSALGNASNPGRAGHAYGGMHFAAGGFGFPVGVAYALLVLTGLLFNVLGTDGSGVQFYFMAPVRFRQVLLGKNLAYGLILAFETVFLLLAATWIDGPPSAAVLAMTLAGLAFAALCDFTCGNLLSLYMPKKIDLGRLGRQSSRGTSGLAALGVQAIEAALIAMAILGGIVLHRTWLSLAILAALATGAAAVYAAVLTQTDAIAQTRRETLISELSKA